MAKEIVKLSGVVEYIVDGDTYDIMFYLPFGVYVSRRCRLNGVDTWETRGANRELGLLAKEFCKKQMFEKDCIAICHGPDKYGREIVDLTIGGVDVAWLLQKYGHLK